MTLPIPWFLVMRCTQELKRERKRGLVNTWTLSRSLQMTISTNKSSLNSGFPVFGRWFILTVSLKFNFKTLTSSGLLICLPRRLVSMMNPCLICMTLLILSMLPALPGMRIQNNCTCTSIGLKSWIRGNSFGTWPIGSYPRWVSNRRKLKISSNSGNGFLKNWKRRKFSLFRLIMIPTGLLVSLPGVSTVLKRKIILNHIHTFVNGVNMKNIV